MVLELQSCTLPAAPYKHHCHHNYSITARFDKSELQLHSYHLALLALFSVQASPQDQTPEASNHEDRWPEVPPGCKWSRVILNTIYNLFCLWGCSIVLWRSIASLKVWKPLLAFTYETVASVAARLTHTMAQSRHTLGVGLWCIYNRNCTIIMQRHCCRSLIVYLNCVRTFQHVADSAC